jgi:hypothetical protein
VAVSYIAQFWYLAMFLAGIVGGALLFRQL